MDPSEVSGAAAAGGGLKVLVSPGLVPLKGSADLTWVSQQDIQHVVVRRRKRLRYFLCRRLHPSW